MNTCSAVLGPVGSFDSRLVLRWVFRKRNRLITCLLQQREVEQSYEICLVPHWDIASAVSVQTDTSLSAFCRHAEFAMHLRAAGWAVVARSR